MRPLILLLALAGAPAWGGSDDVLGAAWSFRDSAGQCLLEQPVRDFGQVRFVSSPGARLRLEVLGHRELFAEGPVQVLRVAPPWHVEFPQQQRLGEVAHRAGSGLLIGEPLSLQVLQALRQGWHARLEHTARHGGEAAVPIGNVRLRPYYDRFLRCARGPTADGFAGHARTRIEYASGEAALDEADQARLRRVAEYVLADSGVERVYIDGHTDDVGSPAERLALSRRRAEQVAGFLREAGIAEPRLVVRWHGGQYPVMPPVDDAARARNRRTTVRLERSWPEEQGLATR